MRFSAFSFFQQFAIFIFTSQADEKANADMLAVKDRHIAALLTQLEGKERIIQAKVAFSIAKN